MGWAVVKKVVGVSMRRSRRECFGSIKIGLIIWVAENLNLW